MRIICLAVCHACVLSGSVVSSSLQPYGLQPARLLCPWDFPGNCTGVDCHFLLQGIFPTQGSNPGLPHCRQTLYRLSHQGSPIRTKVKLKLRLLVGRLPYSSDGKESACNAGDFGGVGSIPGLQRSPGGVNGNPLQYFCLENPMDRGAWQATVHRV